MTNPESRFLVVARHGELNNPGGRLYTTDSLTNPERPEDIMHINDEGIAQMHLLAQALIDKKFNVTIVHSSPSVRALESANIVAQDLGGIEVVVDKDLDDVEAPGPYIEGMTIEELAKAGGNVYDNNRWGKNKTEEPIHAKSRMERGANRVISSLKEGQTGIIFSHGDSNAWYLNTLNGEPIPDPANLRNLIYPAKGEAVVLSISPDNKFSVLYTLPEHQENRNIY